MTNTMNKTTSLATGNAGVIDEELEKIMSEIEELQQEMDGTTRALANPMASSAAASTSAVVGAPDVVPPVADVPVVVADPIPMTTRSEEENILREIQASAQIDDSDMESTLASIKGEEGGGILDQTISEQIDSSIAASEAEMIASTENSFVQSQDDFAEIAQITQKTLSPPKTEKSMSESDGSLTMTLTGNMKLKLKYEFEGQEVTISFVDQSLQVSMTDGTEFKIPVSRLQSNVTSLKKTG